MKNWHQFVNLKSSTLSLPGFICGLPANQTHIASETKSSVISTVGGLKEKKQTNLNNMKEMLYEGRCWKKCYMNTALHITFLSYDIPFTGKHEPNKLTCSQLCDLVAQLVRALHRHRRGHGFESRWVTWDNCLNCPSSARIISSFETSIMLMFNIY